MTEYDTQADELRDTDEYPMTPAEFELAAQCLEETANQVAGAGQENWEARARMYFRIANRMRDYSRKHIDR